MYVPVSATLAVLLLVTLCVYGAVIGVPGTDDNAYDSAPADAVAVALGSDVIDNDAKFMPDATGCVAVNDNCDDAAVRDTALPVLAPPLTVSATDGVHAAVSIDTVYVCTVLLMFSADTAYSVKDTEGKKPDDDAVGCSADNTRTLKALPLSACVPSTATLLVDTCAPAFVLVAATVAAVIYARSIAAAPTTPDIANDAIGTANTTFEPDTAACALLIANCGVCGAASHWMVVLAVLE